LAAVDPSAWRRPIITRAEYKELAAGKAARGRLELGPELISYNALDGDILERLMTDLAEGLEAEGLSLHRDQWIGPGHAAAAWLRQINAPRGEAIAAVTPPPVTLRAIASYYGGWFEIFAHGVIPGTSYSYDRNSAYPEVIARLPCLLHGKWHFGPGDTDGLKLVKAKLRGRDPNIGAMQHRRPDGRILRPQQTEGW